MIKNLKIKLYYFVYIKNVFTFQDIIKNIKLELEYISNAQIRA